MCCPSSHKVYANTYVLVFSLCVCVCVVTGMANSRIRNSSLSSALCSRVKQPSMHSTPIRVEPLISISASSCTLAPRRDDDASVRFRKINLIPRTSFVPIQFSHSLSLTHTHTRANIVCTTPIQLIRITFNPGTHIYPPNQSSHLLTYTWPGSFPFRENLSLGRQKEFGIHGGCFSCGLHIDDVIGGSTASSTAEKDEDEEEGEEYHDEEEDK